MNAPRTPDHSAQDVPPPAAEALLPPVVAAIRAERVGPGKAMRASFFEFQHKPSLVETAFELVHRHLAAGDSVAYRFLGYDLPYTYMSPVPGSTLFGPWLPERTAARLVAHPNLTFVPRTRMRLRPLPFEVPDTLDELMALRLDGFDVGMAVASSTISLTRDSRFRPADRRSEVRRVLQGAIATYDHASTVLDDERPDLVYLFNGRFAYERAVLRACQERRIPCLLYEWGSSPERFFLRPFSTHDRVRVQDEMRSAWRDAPDRRRAREEATRWFVERREGQPRDWPSFTSLQRRSVVPERAPGARTIAYFSSSDDEFVAIGDEYRWHGWPGQLDAVRDLIRVVHSLHDTRLVLRIHPHLVHKHPHERTRWMALQEAAPEVIVVPPESHVDTYALIEESDVVVTGGSTVGAEAAFWGRPSVLLGPSEYDELGITHRPRSGEELRRILVDTALPAHREAALVYGYYRATFGEPYRVYEPTGFHRGTFLGTDLRSGPWKVLAEGRRRAVGVMHALRRLRSRVTGHAV